MKKYYVSNLREGAKVEDVFLVASKSVAHTRTGSPYLKVTLADKTGEVNAIKWDATESEITRLQEDDYIFVYAAVRNYNDHPQLQVESFQRWGEAVDPADFVRSSPFDPDQMMAELSEILAQVADPNLRALLDKLFSDQDFVRKFRQAPAAKKVHHAYVSGLLEHSLGVVKTCVAFADRYPQANRDLLITGAVLHDVGKIQEFEWNGSIKYSSSGVLVGHIVVGAMLAKDLADSIDGFDPILSLTLQHIILSHHGEHEYGSPKLPKCIEAMMLHCADDLDAKVAILGQAIEESDVNGGGGLFTQRHYLLGRPIFKGVHKIAEPPDVAVSEHAAVEEGEADLDLFAADVDYDPFADE
ncbi:MAG: HD domain-containing protein [Armatimonadota bacterium]|nr:HD domain-containing protein [bacterium]